MKLFGPDTLWNPQQITGALFLYFHDEKITFTLHPSVSTFMTEVNPLTFLNYLNKQNPSWKDHFMRFFSYWQTYQTNLIEMQKILSPLQETSCHNILLSYGRGKQAWEAAGEIIESSSLETKNITTLIDPFHAADELFSHLFLEKVLEVKYMNEKANNIQNTIERIKNTGTISFDDEFDWKPIYEYCDELFSNNSLDYLLTRAYMFRMPLMKMEVSDSFLLSNQMLENFLTSLPVEYKTEKAKDNSIKFDVIAWEFFRQLLSPYIDPLDNQKVIIIQKLITSRKEEIERLKNKCYQLAKDISSETNLNALTQKVSKQVKAEVLNDLRDLLQIDQSSFDKLINEIFSDPKTWCSLATFVYSMINGTANITAGSAIFALSTFGAKAFKQAASRREKLKTNDYSLIYRMKNMSV